MSSSFFQQETCQVAVQLLGQTLVHVTQDHQFLKGKIVETEAYLGLHDPSCHSFGGRRTSRTQTMYLPGGYAYVYFTYGMHHCFNIVTAGKEDPSAVLIRAVEPLEGVPQMTIFRKQNSKRKSPCFKYDLTNGPAKVCQAMNICKKLNGQSLQGDVIYVEKDRKIRFFEIGVSERIGLSKDSDSYYWPLRFFIKNNPYVSHV